MDKDYFGFLKKIETSALDILFPIACASCGRENAWLCDECLDKIELLSYQICPICEREITEKGVLCKTCKNNNFEKDRKVYLASLLLASEYKNISSLVHSFKYRFIEKLGEPLGKILLGSLLKYDQPLPDIIIPIPLHRRRLRWRGFNQSEILARYVAENLCPGFIIPVFPELLQRRKYTSPQMKIKSYQERISNLENAFAIDPDLQESIRNKNILLIDDIVTTGTTILECAKTLSQNGAKKVSAAALARQKVE